MEQELCNLKHAQIDERLDGHDRLFETTTNDITALKLGQTATNTRMDNVCNKIDKLIDVLYDLIKSTVGCVLVFGVGFIIWYIQGL